MSGDCPTVLINTSVQMQFAMLFLNIKYRFMHAIQFIILQHYFTTCSIHMYFRFEEMAWNYFLTIAMPCTTDCVWGIKAIFNIAVCQWLASSSPAISTRSVAVWKITTESEHSPTTKSNGNYNTTVQNQCQTMMRKVLSTQSYICYRHSEKAWGTEIKYL